MSTALDYLVAARRCEINELTKLSHTCDLVLVVNELIHCLQQERGISNVFLGSAGQLAAPLCTERIGASDAAHVTVRTWLEQAESTVGFSGGARLYTKIALALHALDELPGIRAAVAAQRCTPEENSEHYKRLIAALLSLIFEAADVAVDPDISRLLIAFFHLMQGKEFAGQERATGAAAFAAGQIGSEQLHSIEYLIEMQEQSFQRFESFAGHFRKEWQALQATLPLAELERMRRKLLTSPGRGLDKTLAEAWFACCTARMDELHRAEKHLADVLQQLCREKIAKLHGESGQEEISLPGQESPAPLSPLTAFSTRLTADMPDLGNAGFGPQLTQSVVDMLRLQSERLQNLTEELATARAGIEERKLIERAKGILMVHRGLNEESAYRFLRQNAMNQNRRIIDVAHAILSLADMLPGKTD
ncbi:MAG: nitrate- and nitrite sensing domain-containing protein [Azovibrio sp.]|uniref:nitrate- and nitrite sensing domain-containing protein n=1 Tax=Azovibrio sp. TaxID=1872673 RepID=UPI003C776EAB